MFCGPLTLQVQHIILEYYNLLQQSANSNSAFDQWAKIQFS